MFYKARKSKNNMCYIGCKISNGASRALSASEVAELYNMGR